MVNGGVGFGQAPLCNGEQDTVAESKSSGLQRPCYRLLLWLEAAPSFLHGVVKEPSQKQCTGSCGAETVLDVLRAGIRPSTVVDLWVTG